MRDNISEITVAGVLITLLILLVNPMDFWMSSSIVMMIEIIILTLFAVFAIFIWREQIQDERESLHRLMADRIAFLVGAGILLLSILWQSFWHSLDFLLVIALCCMILAKTAGLIYNRIKN